MLIFIPFLSRAEALAPETTEPVAYVLCRNRSTVRTIRVEFDDKTKLFVTTYTKNGLDKVVGKAQNKASCTNVLENIRGNLEKASWKCKDVNNADVHAPASVQE